jgi:hypothetical protein
MFPKETLKSFVCFARWLLRGADLKVGWGLSFLRHFSGTLVMKSRARQQPSTRIRSDSAPTEGILAQLFAWLDNSLVQQAAGELARECHIALWEVTCDRAREMSSEEARGYIRAFAPEFLVREVDMVLQRRRVRESLRLRILAEATDQVVELVLKDIGRARSRRAIGKAA